MINLVDRYRCNRVQYPIYTASGTQGTACVQVDLLVYESNIETANGVNRLSIRSYYKTIATSNLA